MPNRCRNDAGRYAESMLFICICIFKPKTYRRYAGRSQFNQRGSNRLPNKRLVRSTTDLGFERCDRLPGKANAGVEFRGGGRMARAVLPRVSHGERKICSWCPEV